MERGKEKGQKEKEKEREGEGEGVGVGVGVGVGEGIGEGKREGKGEEKRRSIPEPSRAHRGEENIVAYRYLLTDLPPSITGHGGHSTHTVQKPHLNIPPFTGQLPRFTYERRLKRWCDDMSPPQNNNSQIRAMRR